MILRGCPFRMMIRSVRVIFSSCAAQIAVNASPTRVGDPARSFLSAAREVARTKPIIVIKAGRTQAAAKAAASHTGAMTGSDEVLDAAFRRCGVLRVHRIAELLEMADVG